MSNLERVPNEKSAKDSLDFAEDTLFSARVNCGYASASAINSAMCRGRLSVRSTS